MDFELQNIYQRLRDFHIPAPVLDEIFRDEKSLTVLTEAWYSLEEEGLKGDDAAREIAKLIYQEFPELADLVDDHK